MKAILGDPLKDALRKSGDDPQLAPSGPAAGRDGSTAGRRQGRRDRREDAREGRHRGTRPGKQGQGDRRFLERELHGVAARIGNVPALALLRFRLEVLGKTVGSATATDKIELSSQTHGSTWLVSAKMPNQVLADGLKTILPPKMVLLRTASDMAEGPTRIFTLAAATQAMADSGLKDPEYLMALLTRDFRSAPGRA